MTKKDKVISILSEYNGQNPYILSIKSDLFTWRRSNALDDFRIDFVLRNYKDEPRPINKIVRLSKWLGEKKKEDWGTEFVPDRVKVLSYLGDTERYYCCIIQYRRSIDPIMCFLPKNGILTNMFVEDYTNYPVDFERYDRLSALRDPKRKLQPHQKEAVRFLLSRKKCILAHSMGLGKTCSLTVAAIEGNFDSVLIICPASLKNNWKNELMWYVPERDITVVDGFLDKKKNELEEFLGYSHGKSGKKKEELLEEAKEKGKWVDNRFVIVNYDILDEFYKTIWARSEAATKKHLESHPMMKYLYNKKSLLIIDEAHKLSNSTSNRYKLINNLIRITSPESIYLSTGTPVTNMPQNLFCLLKLLDAPIACDWNFFTEQYCGAKKIILGNEWNKWCKNYLEMTKQDSYSALSPEQKTKCKEYIDKHAKKITVMKDVTNVDELKEAISYLYLRRTKEEVTNLPKKYIHEVTYDLSSEQRDKYEKLWSEYEQAKLDENPDKVLNKDLLEGSVYRMYLAEQMVKNTIDLANSFLENGEKVVIACCFDNELYALKEYYGSKCVIFNGKCSLKQKDAAVEAFVNDSDVTVFIGNINAAGTGITLTVSHRLIFCSYSYTYADNSQMEDRIHRIGQDKECHIYYQMFNDTHCEHMWDIVLKKQYLSEALITENKR